MAVRRNNSDLGIDFKDGKVFANSVSAKLNIINIGTMS